MVEAIPARPQEQTQPDERGQDIPVRLSEHIVPDESLLSPELRRKLWEGMIALKIDLALDD